MTKKTKAPKKNKKKTGIRKKKFYVIIKGKKHFISPDLIERYRFRQGERIPFTHLKILQEK
jgi:hypothetical protein